MTLEIHLIPAAEFRRIEAAGLHRHESVALLADMCRANALATVKRAGSGHLGSSLSCIDIVTWLYYAEMNTRRLGFEHPDRDIYFSSKGHDAPAHYAVLYALGVLAEHQFINLRRLGGTHGHPDVCTRGIEVNSGSLGMGISKARGLAFGKQLRNAGGQVFVLTGDGELQEGQIWESLQTTAHQSVGGVTAIVDANRIQSDKPVGEILDLLDLEAKFAAFGWHVERCDGHDCAALETAFDRLRQVQDRPKVLIADTVKGKGVSFMEGPAALAAGLGLYPWHSGAPDDARFRAAWTEVRERIDARLQELGLAPLTTAVIDVRKPRTRLKDSAGRVVDAYARALVELGGVRKDMVVLDADLSADCGLRPFETTYPERFVENGIAEQDMVSMAGGLALQGLLPVVNSFGVFLASRANEQIYNNATENSRILYVCHYAGLIPAGPGKSHQSLRDVSLFGALPNCTVVEPCNDAETRQVMEWCVNRAQQSCMVRLAIGPSPGPVELPGDYTLVFGQGSVLVDGTDAILFAYGPVMLHEALNAAALLRETHFSLKVVNLPWLNRVDNAWLEKTIGALAEVFVIDNHAAFGGLGDCLLNALMASDALRGRRLTKFAVEDFPACGTPAEVLDHHRLSAPHLARRIRRVSDSSRATVLEAAS